MVVEPFMVRGEEIRHANASAFTLLRRIKKRSATENGCGGRTIPANRKAMPLAKDGGQVLSAEGGMVRDEKKKVIEPFPSRTLKRSTTVYFLI